jgi:hypothetical protein
MKKTLGIIVGLICLLKAGGVQAGEFKQGCVNNDNEAMCKDDNEALGIYRICNYFPLDAGNKWKYTTGDRFVLDNKQKCSSGYTGILYGSNTYQYSPYMQNGKNGLLFTGCQYDKGWLKDWGIRGMLIPASMKVGQTVSQYWQPYFGDYGAYFDTTLIGLETITVPAGTFNTLKILFEVNHDDGSCSYKTTIWLVKGIGPVKIQRTDPNPPNCLGCVFVCDPDNDLIKLNTPAELISAVIKGIIY